MSTEESSTPERRSIGEWVDIGELEPYVANPRDNTKAITAVKNSIEAFGFLVPIVADSAGVIAAGHTRYAAATELGLTEVPVIRADHLTDYQIAQFRIIDNKVSELAAWDIDLLSQEMTALTESGINFTDFGFTSEEMDCLVTVVDDDCLSDVADVSGARSSGSDDASRPSVSRFVCGEIVFYAEADVYRRWASALREDNEYDSESIVADLKNRIGISEYED